MRLSPILLAICILHPGAASADDSPQPKKKIPIPDAASLIGKKIDGDRQSDIATNAPKTKSADWSYGFEYDDSGLERSAWTPQRGKPDALLSASYVFDSRCGAGDKAADFSFGADESFKLKGSPAKGQFANAWLYLGDADKFDDKPLKLKMDFSENDAAMHFKLDAASLSSRAMAAFCPTDAPPSKAGGHCATFSLKGFARAYDYVCEAK
jgi:hypothetical protein